jgi:ketosteroid isomerase-like protein
MELVRRLYDAVASRDTERVLALYDTDVEWDFTRHPLAHLIGAEIHRGHEGLRRFFRDLSSVWESIVWELEKVDATTARSPASFGSSKIAAASGLLLLTAFANFPPLPRLFV